MGGQVGENPDGQGFFNADLFRLVRDPNAPEGHGVAVNINLAFNGGTRQRAVNEAHSERGFLGWADDSIL
jgi:hypothetical protein